MESKNHPQLRISSLVIQIKHEIGKSEINFNQGVSGKTLWNERKLSWASEKADSMK